MNPTEEEKAVLGAVMASAQCLKEVSGILVENDFYREEHRIIWRAISELEMEKRAVDELSVVSKLKEHRCLTRAGGAAYVASLTSMVPDVANAKYYAESVREAAADRELRRIGQRLMEEGVKPAHKMDIAFASLSELNRHSMVTKESKIGVLSRDLLSKIVEGNGFHDGVKMGFPQLDNPMGGLGRENYIILAARPGVGKSAFSLQVGYNAAKQGYSVLYISPEMSEEQLTRRLLSMVSGVEHGKLLKPNLLNEGEIAKLKEANDCIRGIPLVIDDSASQTVTKTRLAARRHDASSGLDLLIIDYLQLLCEGDDSKEAVTMVSRGLKAIAKDLNVPVLACSQLRRAYGDDAYKRPEKSQLRGSGQLEQDADQILMMWQPHAKDKSKIEVFLDKNRHGPLGQVTLKFDNNTTKFSVPASMEW